MTVLIRSRGQRRAAFAVSSIVGIVTLSLGAAALAGAGDKVPSTDPGPYINYCPTQDQVETHFEEFGFDYKPTGVCGEDGHQVSTPSAEESPRSNAEARKQARELLAGAERVPDGDGDPATMELVLSDGTHVMLTIEGDLEYYADMTPAELAEAIYGEEP